MKRKAHVVSSFGMGNNPGLVLTVQAGTERRFLSDSDEVGAVELVVWDCRVIELTASRGALVDHYTGQTVQSWWHLVEQMQSGGRRLLIVSNFAREHCAILGLWESVLQGRASIGAASGVQAGADQQARADAWDGYAILEGPPTIVRFRLGETLAPIEWIDCRNWGGAPPMVGMVKSEPADTPLLAWGDEPWMLPGSVAAQSLSVAMYVLTYAETLQRLNLGAIELTVASQAMAGYRRRYMQFPITVHDNERVTTLERNALFGGRCEVAFLGTVQATEGQRSQADDDDVARATYACKSLVYHLDVNSLYPAVAYGASLPTYLATVAKFVPVKDALAAATCCPIIADVTVRIERPVVPWRFDRRDAQLANVNGRAEAYAAAKDEPAVIYPVGEVRVTLCGPEILLAAKYGEVLKVHTLALYEGRPIYNQWVRELYAERRRLTDKGMYAMAGVVKSLLNSSFSKWAQHKLRWVNYDNELCHMPFFQWWQKAADGGPPEQWRSFAWRVQRLERVGEPPDSFPAITAYINSLARVRLWELLEIARAGKVFYYDTDSIWCDAVGYNALLAANKIGETGLGNLKLVGKYEQVRFLGVKRYLADGRLTMAGANAPTVASGDAFALQIAAPPTGYYLARGEAPGIERRCNRVRVSLPYLIGEVGADGWVKPWQAHA